jgi:hypothetical protein
MRLGAFGTTGGTTGKWRLGGVLCVLGPSLNISSYGLAEVAVMAAALVAIATLAAAIISM